MTRIIHNIEEFYIAQPIAAIERNPAIVQLCNWMIFPLFFRAGNKETSKNRVTGQIYKQVSRISAT